MLRYLFLLSLIFSLNAYSDVFLSSPKIKLNAQNQRVIEFRIENERINDGDITLNEYNINITENILKTFRIILDLYKKNKNLFFKDLLLFYSEYYLKIKKEVKGDINSI